MDKSDGLDPSERKVTSVLFPAVVQTIIVLIIVLVIIIIIVVVIILRMQVFKFPAVVELAILEQRGAVLASRSSLPFWLPALFPHPGRPSDFLTFRLLATDIPIPHSKPLTGRRHCLVDPVSIFLSFFFFFFGSPSAGQPRSWIIAGVNNGATAGPGTSMIPPLATETYK